MIVTKEFDLICLGCVAVDLYAEQLYCDLSEVQTYRQYLGGSCANVAVGAARLGLKTVVVSRVGQDALGHFIRKELSGYNVDTRWLKISDKHKTSLMLLSINPPDKFTQLNYRDNCADLHLLERDCEEALFNQARALFISGENFATVQMRNVSQYAIQLAKNAEQKVILDVSYVEESWSEASKRSVSEHYQFFLSQCDVIIATENELSIVIGKLSVDAALRKLRELTSAIVLLKQEGQSCIVFDVNSLIPVTIPGYETKILNTLGAGDAFVSGFISGYLSGCDIVDSSKRANAACALIVTKHSCAPEMPELGEIEKLILPDTISKIDIFSRTQKHRQKNESSMSLCMLAFDHRYYFKENNELTNEKIQAFKELIYASFLKSDAHRLNRDIQSGVIVDDAFSINTLREESDSIICVPIESANTQFLSWSNQRDLYSQILHRPKRWWVKVKVKLESDMSIAQLEHQVIMLSHLQEVCDSLDRTLVLDLATTNVLWAMKYIFQHSITPTWWKISAEYDHVTWKRIETLTGCYQQTPKIMVLGGDVNGYNSLKNNFAQAKHCSWVRGFAIGRNIFWSAFLQWSAGEINDDQAIDSVTREYDKLTSIWQNTQALSNESFLGEFVDSTEV